ncbi:MAG: IS3 family transposase, partial [Desulfovibrio sp.]|nr:IS3 family transposase [Desulfovibrio sp.]
TMASHMETDLMLEALEMATAQRRAPGVIHHPDQGSQYTPYRLGKRCQSLGVRLSMGSVGDCFDDAFIHGKRPSWPFLTSLRDGNITHRRYSALDYMSPLTHEKRYGLTS